MNKRNALFILSIVIASASLVFLFCYYCATTSIVKITDDNINSMDLNLGSEELQKLGNLTKDQYKSILIGIGIYSNLRYNDFGLADIEKKIKDNGEKTDRDFIDIFMASLTNFLFNYKNGVSKVLNEDEPIFKHVKAFLLQFVSKDNIKASDKLKEYLLKYNIQDKVHKHYDESILKKLDVKIPINFGDKVDEYKSGDLVWGMYLEYFANNARLPLNQ